MDDLTGSMLNDYRLLRLLGRGAMASVYLAEQGSLARLVALKVLNADLSRDEAYVARFQHEARAAASLVHANIAQVYEVGLADGHHYLAQEYLAGGSLGLQLKREGRLGPERAVAVLRQVAQALSVAAQQGLVHRDIKPDNLLLDRSGAVKVADFGLARIHTSTEPRLTQEGVTLGTPLYMSPEQIEGRAIDTRSDLYSLGVTAYHLLVGAPPFRGDTAMAVAAQHLREEPRPLQEQVPGLPAWLVEIIHRLMAKSPDQRFASPDVLLDVLSRAETPQGVTTSSSQIAELQRAMATLSAAEKPTRSPRSKWAFLALLAILGGAILAFATRSPGLLAETNRGAVEREESAELQLYRAKVLGTPSAWRAVESFFPKADEFYHLLALRGLVESLFAQGDYQAALGPLRRLAARGSDEPEFGLFGQAGLVIANVKLGRFDAAQRARGHLPVDRAERAELRRTAPLMAEALEQAETSL